MGWGNGSGNCLYRENAVADVEEREVLRTVDASDGEGREGHGM